MGKLHKICKMTEMAKKGAIMSFAWSLSFENQISILLDE